MINLYDILEAADGQLFGEPAAQLFPNFCYDAHAVQSGDLYVAMKTEHGDGHHFMAQAVQNGAAGIMCTHPPTFDTDGLTVIVMRSVEDALLRWTQLVLQKYGTTVIAVAGSTGKTTAQHAIAQVLRRAHRVYIGESVLDGRLGLPLALGKLTADDRFAVLEFSATHSGEMAELVALARPIVGVVTTVQHRHLGRFGSLEALAEELRALVQGLPPEGLAVLNFDDAHVRALAADAPVPTLTVGLDIAEPAFGADLLAYNVLMDADKTGFDLRYGQARHPGRWIPWLGVSHLYGALLALAVGLSYGVSLEDGLAALTELEPLPGRMCPLEGVGGALVVDDSCNASLEATLTALDWLSAVKEQGRAIGILGDLDDLGPHTSIAPVQIGKRAAATLDMLVTVGDFAAEIGRAAIEEGMPRERVAITFSAGDAAHAVQSTLGPQDIVLVKGGQAARLERVVQHLLADAHDHVKLVRQTGLYEVVQVERPLRPSWVVVDLQAIAYNTRRLKDIIGPDVALMAVVKGDAYGHGAVAVSTTALNNGAEYLAVSTLDEALTLRSAGIGAPILVDGYVPPWAARDVLHHELTVALYDVEAARLFDRAAAEAGQPLRVHVKLDLLGAAGFGLPPQEVTLFFRNMAHMPHLEVEGIYATLPEAHNDLETAAEHAQIFEDLVAPVRAAGFRFRYQHVANSAATLHVPQARFSMVRVGSALYGLAPGPLAPLPADFSPALEWKTLIGQIKRGPHGAPAALRPNTPRSGQWVALLPVGFGDGLRHGPLGWQHVLVHGERAPVLGQVGLDVTAIDISHIEGVEVGEEVVLLGQQGPRVLAVSEIAEQLNTTPQEVLCTILARVPRLK